MDSIILGKIIKVTEKMPETISASVNGLEGQVLHVFPTGDLLIKVRKSTIEPHCAVDGGQFIIKSYWDISFID